MHKQETNCHEAQLSLCLRYPNIYTYIFSITDIEHSLFINIAIYIFFFFFIIQRVEARAIP